MGSFSVSFDPRGFPNPKIALAFPGRDPKTEPKVRYCQPPVNTVSFILKQFSTLNRPANWKNEIEKLNTKEK